MIKISNLHVSIEGKEILRGLDLEIKSGEVHAVMGPNGSGKSTLSKIIAGAPGYTITSGKIEYEINGKYTNLDGLQPEDRAREGVFLAFQYPVEIPGVTNFKFLKESFNAICKHQGAPEMDDGQFEKFITKKAEQVNFKSELLYRNTNEGFSGGEKKRNEILQMAVLSPRLAILDEIDSGLDIDALKAVASGVNKLRSQDRAMLIITHYQRLLDLITPDVVHILAGGKIVETGDKSLALRLEKEGYHGLH